jgi:hypothetical protein
MRNSIMSAVIFIFYRAFPQAIGLDFIRAAIDNPPL